MLAVEEGGALGRAFLSANSEKRRPRRMRGEFPGTPPPLSLVKAQRGTLRAASARFDEHRDSDGEHKRDRGTADEHPARSIRGGGQLRAFYTFVPIQWCF